MAMAGGRAVAAAAGAVDRGVGAEAAAGVVAAVVDEAPEAAAVITVLAK